MLDTWFSSALWPFATLGWPDDTPELRAFYPTSFLTTAREILFLWVARMIMTGIEFPGDVPFRDVYVHSVIQARDGRRMSKSLGTGIDPLEEIDVHGADALRFGLLAMSSTQDVRYSDAKVEQGRDLANKLWNASRLILLNAAEVEPAPRPLHVEDRWILSRLERTIASVTEKLEAYDFAHAAQEAYSFFWSELCDWYLEIVKPRLYEGEAEVSATLLCALERVLALLHPIMPFVTEEIWSHHPARAGHLAVHPFPEADEALFDEAAERDVEGGIALTRRLRAWRDLVEVPVASTLLARVDGVEPQEFVGRLARFEFAAATAATRSPRSGRSRCSTPSEIDAGAVAERLEKRREELRAEVERGERKLANEGFVAKAPAEVVEEERGKLERYRAELEDLGDRPEAYLDSLEPIGWKLGLERMHRLCTMLGMPQHRFASIHVVGTNGKSSVTRMTAALLEAHGVAAGACVSPHPSRWSERVLIRGEEIGAERVRRRRRPHRRGRRDRRPRARGGRGGDPVRGRDRGRLRRLRRRPRRRGRDRGRAGREAGRDQHDPLAGDGADLGRPRPHRVAGGDRARDRRREARRPARRDDPGARPGRPRGPRRWRSGPPPSAARSWSCAAEDPGEGVRLRAPGAFQRRNFALAMAAAEAYLGEPGPERVAEVAATLTVPGRLELLAGEPPTLLDAAHNPDGAARPRRGAARGRRRPPGRSPCLASSPTRTPRASSPRSPRPSTAPSAPSSPRPSGRRRPARSSLAACEAAGLPAEAEPDFAAALGRARALAGAGGRRRARHRLPLRPRTCARRALVIPLWERYPAISVRPYGHGQRGRIRTAVDDGPGRRGRRRGDPDLLRNRLPVREPLPLTGFRGGVAK